MSLKKKEHTLNEEKGTHAEQNFTIPLIQILAWQEDVKKSWKEVKAIVLGYHEISPSLMHQWKAISALKEIDTSNVWQLNSLFPLFERDMTPTP